MKAALFFAFFCLFIAVKAGAYGPGVMSAIYKNWPKDMPKVVDYRYCANKPEHQFRYGCHTAAVHFHLETQLCLAGGGKEKVSLSKHDFWSCKTKWGVQHGIMIANWFNQNGAFTTEVDQKWSNKLAGTCKDAWTKGGGKNGVPPCHCRRFNDTKNPNGPVDMSKRVLMPNYLDNPSMQGCPVVTKSRDDAWKNEMRLAYLVWKFGPQLVESSVESFGYGNPNKPSEKCVGKGQGGGHNYVVTGFNATRPHKSYWILSDSMRNYNLNSTNPDLGYGFGLMWNKCPEKHHLGTQGIAEAGVHRYCLKGDKRGKCGGALNDCGQKHLRDILDIAGDLY